MNTPEPETDETPASFRARLWAGFSRPQRAFLKTFAIAVMLILVLGIGALITQKNEAPAPPQPPSSDSDIVPSAPEPSLIPTPESSDVNEVNESTPMDFTAPAEQEATDHKKNPEEAADELYDFAGRAVRSYFYSNTDETPEQRQERLAVYFVEDDRAITDPPLYVAEGSLSGVSDAVINSYHPVETDAKATKMQVLVSVTWSIAAWAPGGEEGAETFGGDNVVSVDVEVIDGVWKASNIDRRA